MRQRIFRLVSFFLIVLLSLPQSVIFSAELSSRSCLASIQGQEVQGSLRTELNDFKKLRGLWQALGLEKHSDSNVSFARRVQKLVAVIQNRTNKTIPDRYVTKLANLAVMRDAYVAKNEKRTMRDAYLRKILAKGRLPRVAVVHYSFPPVMGGVNVILGEQVKWLANNGFPVKVIAGNDDKSLQFPNLDYVSDDSLERVSEQDDWNIKAMHGEITEEFKKQKKHIYDLLQKQLSDQDIVIIHNVLAVRINLAFSAALHDVIKDNPRKHFVTYLHNVEERIYDEYPLNLLNPYIDAPNVSYVTVSEAYRKHLSDDFGISQEKINVVNPGVHLYTPMNITKAAIKDFPFDSELNLFIPTRIDWNKDIVKALQVVRVLREDRNIKARLVIASAHVASFDDLLEQTGQRIGQETVAELLKMKKIAQEYVTFLDTSRLTDFSEHRQYIMDLMALSDVLLFPSKMETFGMPIVEAGIVRTGIVASDLGPHRDIVAGNAQLFSLDATSSDIADIVIKATSKSNEFAKEKLQKTMVGRYVWDEVMRTQFLPVIYDIIEFKPSLVNAMTVFRRGDYDKAFEMVWNALRTVQAEHSLEAEYLDSIEDAIRIVGYHREKHHQYVSPVYDVLVWLLKGYATIDSVAWYQDLDSVVSSCQILFNNPRDTVSLNRIGHIFKRYGEWEKAVTAYKNVLTVDARNTEAHNGIAQVYEGQGEITDASSWYKRTLAIDQNNWEAQEALDHITDIDDGLICQGISACREFENNISTIRKNEVTAEYRARIITVLSDASKNIDTSHNERKKMLKHLQKISSDSFKIYAFRGIVKNRNDFFLGQYRADSNELFVSEDLIASLSNESPGLVDEYLLHEALCPVFGHFTTIKLQQACAPQHYPDHRLKAQQTAYYLYKGVLGEQVRQFIDGHSSLFVSAIAEEHMMNYLMHDVQGSKVAAHVSVQYRGHHAKAKKSPRNIIAFPGGEASLSFESFAPTKTISWDIADLQPVVDGDSRGIEGLFVSNSKSVSIDMRSIILNHVLNLRMEIFYGHDIRANEKEFLRNLKSLSRNEQLQIENILGCSLDSILSTRIQVTRNNNGSHSVTVKKTTFDGNNHYLLSIVIPAEFSVLYENDVLTVTGNTPVEMQVAAMTDFEPLTPMRINEIFNQDAIEKMKEDAGFRAQAEQFSLLCYKEKVLAGSWLYTAYFGRDTLVSARLMWPALSSEMKDIIIQSVLNRIGESEDGTIAQKTNGLVAVTDEVSNEYFFTGEIMDPFNRAMGEGHPSDAFALLMLQLTSKKRPQKLLYDVLDNTFLFPEMLKRLLFELPESARIKFLSKKNMLGETNYETMCRHFDRIFELSGAYTADIESLCSQYNISYEKASTVEGFERSAKNLIRLIPREDGFNDANWRDSWYALGGGVYPADINISLVPSSLAAIRSVIELLDTSDYGFVEKLNAMENAKVRFPVLSRYLAEPQRVKNAQDAWSTARDHFRVFLNKEDISKRLEAYLHNASFSERQKKLLKMRVIDKNEGITVQEIIEGTRYPVWLNQGISFSGISLKADGTPVPIMHSDEIYSLLDTDVSFEELTRIMMFVFAPYPLGLLSEAGVLIANPAFVEDHDTLMQFHTKAYHGPVIWGWPMRALVMGLARQIKYSSDLAKKEVLTRFLKHVLSIRDSLGPLALFEVWSWDIDDNGQMYAVPLEHGQPSCSAQLWSTSAEDILLTEINDILNGDIRDNGEVGLVAIPSRTDERIPNSSFNTLSLYMQAA